MNIYLVERPGQEDYDQYQRFVVCADSETEARQTDASGDGTHHTDEFFWVKDIKNLKITYLGKADGNIKPGVIMYQYNAG